MYANPVSAPVAPTSRSPASALAAGYAPVAAAVNLADVNLGRTTVEKFNHACQIAASMGRAPPRNGSEADFLIRLEKSKKKAAMKELTREGDRVTLFDEAMTSSSPASVLARARQEDVKVISHSISIAGSLDDFANGRAATAWKASNVLGKLTKNLPAGSRLLPISTKVLKERNTTPVKVGVTFEGLRHFELENAMSASDQEMPAHYYVEAHMHQPNSLRFPLYNRNIAADKNVRKSVATWNDVTHEAIDASIFDETDDADYMLVYEDSPILDMIARNKDKPEYAAAMEDSSAYLDANDRRILSISADIGREVKKIAHGYIDTLPFGAPEAIGVSFARADGKPWNDAEALGGSEDERQDALEQRHYIDLVVEQRYHVWSPHNAAKHED